VAKHNSRSNLYIGQKHGYSSFELRRCFWRCIVDGGFKNQLPQAPSPLVIDDCDDLSICSWRRPVFFRLPTYCRRWMLVTNKYLCLYSSSCTNQLCSKVVIASTQSHSIQYKREDLVKDIQLNPTVTQCSNLLSNGIIKSFPAQNLVLMGNDMFTTAECDVRSTQVTPSFSRNLDTTDEGNSVIQLVPVIFIPAFNRSSTNRHFSFLRGQPLHIIGDRQEIEPPMVRIF